MKIGIIVGSTRDQRVGRSVGEWVLEQTQGRAVEYELIDLKDYDLPLLSSATPPAGLDRAYAEPAVQAWSKKIDEMDGFIFVTPEYNHSVPAAMKNAVDVISPEWMRKAVAFVGYGASGGVRAIEAWRVSLANFGMYDIRNVVELSLFTDFGENGFAPAERHTQTVTDLLDTLEPAARAMATLRA